MCIRDSPHSAFPCSSDPIPSSDIFLHDSAADSTQTHRNIFSRNSHHTVSYTHLDVYKRQVLGAAAVYLIQMGLCKLFWNYKLSGTVFFSEKEAREGDTIQLVATVQNQKIIPIITVKAVSYTHLVDSFDFENYAKFFTQYDGWRYIWNTVKLAAINIVGVVLSNGIVAYAIAFLKFRHKKVIMALLLITMMMPGTVTFFPQFLVYVKLGWYGTLMPLWVPAFLGNAYYIFLLRQYYLTIPQPILDAARVCGCGHFRICLLYTSRCV